MKKADAMIFATYHTGHVVNVKKSSDMDQWTDEIIPEIKAGRGELTVQGIRYSFDITNYDDYAMFRTYVGTELYTICFVSWSDHPETVWKNVQKQSELFGLLHNETPLVMLEGVYLVSILMRSVITSKENQSLQSQQDVLKHLFFLAEYEKIIGFGKLRLEDMI